MNMKTLLLIAGVFAAAGFPLTGGAAGRCPAGKSGCTIDDAASRSSVRASESTAKHTASPHEYGRVPLVAPIDAQPEGQTYGRWAAQWWQWAIGVPVAVNPLVDTTGANCAQRQRDEVWFLAGSFGPDRVDRSCEVPAGKSLFFPLINTAYFAFLNDEPPETRTEDYVRAAPGSSCTVPAQISVWIDGFRVPNPTRFFTGASGSQSPMFNVQMPPGNLFGDDGTSIPELVLSPSAEQGYYLFVQPLRPGPHTIRWVASGCTPGASQDITYHLTVLGEGGPHH